MEKYHRNASIALFLHEEVYLLLDLFLSLHYLHFPCDLFIANLLYQFLETFDFLLPEDLFTVTLPLLGLQIFLQLRDL